MVDTTKSDSGSLLRLLLLAVVFGAVFGAIELWWFPFSLRGLGAAMTAGATFAVVLAVFGRFHLAPYIVTALLAGTVAGVVWWAVLRPGPQLWVAAGVGALAGLAMYMGERSTGPTKTGAAV